MVEFFDTSSLKIANRLAERESDRWKRQIMIDGFRLESFESLVVSLLLVTQQLKKNLEEILNTQVNENHQSGFHTFTGNDSGTMLSRQDRGEAAVKPPRQISKLFQTKLEIEV